MVLALSWHQPQARLPWWSSRGQVTPRLQVEQRGKVQARLQAVQLGQVTARLQAEQTSQCPI